MCTMPKSCTTNLVPGQAGMSLIELMVGVVIGMLTILIVANTIITSEGQRRGTSSGSDAQNNAMLAAYLVERDLRMSGYGIFTNETGGVSEVCSVGTVRTYNANRATTDLNYAGDLPFVPVLINPTSIPAADIGSDIIMLNYAGGSLGVVGAGVKFAGNSATTANNYKIENIGGFRAGDLALVAQAGLNCTISEVTGLDAVNSQVLRGTDSYANDYKGGGHGYPSMEQGGRAGRGLHNRRETVQPGAARSIHQRRLCGAQPAIDALRPHDLRLPFLGRNRQSQCLGADCRQYRGITRRNGRG